MDFALLAAKWIVGPLIGIIITVLLTEPLRERLLPILKSIGSRSTPGITGQWRATFHFRGNTDKFVEVIELKSQFGLIVGHIVPSDENYNDLRRVQANLPLRVRGTVKDNMFFSGTWFHPVQTSHHSGSFFLCLNRNNDKLAGRWLGYSETRHVVESDQWVWERLPPKTS